MNDVVTCEETLYRVIKRSQPSALDEDGKPTSALFKQENGVSVSRDGGRSLPNILAALHEKFAPRDKGVISVGAGVCISYHMAVIPDMDNKADPYHANIFDNFDRDPVSQLHALILADNAVIVTYDPEKPWTKGVSVLRGDCGNPETDG